MTLSHCVIINPSKDNYWTGLDRLAGPIIPLSMTAVGYINKPNGASSILNHLINPDARFAFP